MFRTWVALSFEICRGESWGRRAIPSHYVGGAEDGLVISGVSVFPQNSS